jgi:hypothetical protein
LEIAATRKVFVVGVRKEWKMNAQKWSKRSVNALAVLVVLALVSMAAPPVVVHAATTRTIGVDNIPDAFPILGCSLREAISIANAGLTGTVNGCKVKQTGSGTPITYHIFLSGKEPYTYTLTGADGEDGNASGDLDITANVTISGEGVTSFIIDGGGLDRVLHICPGGGCGNSVVLTEVTIRNGYLGGMSYGGGIYNEDGALTVQNSTISNNRASEGGGIRNAGGKVTLLGSTVSDNTAELGGGISSDGMVIVMGSTIGGVGAGNESYMDCGGIHNAGTAAVDGSSVSGNSSDNWGGGICNLGGTLTILNGSIVSGNDTAVGGGGIYSDGGEVTVDGSTVSDNTAMGSGGDGGGIYNEAGTLTVQNGSTIGGPGAGNEAIDIGGGIYNEDGEVTVDGSAVISNTADFGGGTANLSGTLSIWNSAIISNTAGFGGGTGNLSGTLSVRNSIISGNMALGLHGVGGGISSFRGTLTVYSSTISANRAPGHNGNGGGIYSLDYTMTVMSSTISANVAGHNGGGIYSGSIMTMDGSTVSGNVATYRGGGIYNSGLAIVTGSRILNNTAADGGGVFSRRNMVDATKVTGSCIVGNSDTSFSNGEGAMQTATGNWWGSASGPSGVGPGTGDSVGENVDYGGFLTEPILGCYHYTYLPLVLRDSP